MSDERELTEDEIICFEEYGPACLFCGNDLIDADGDICGCWQSPPVEDAR